jgi:serine/threonine-protein kinase
MYREVVALETLAHPSTPKVVEHNTGNYLATEDRLYVVLEYIEGPTLSEGVETSGALSANQAIAVVTGVLDVLDAYHQAGVGHRDIKPDNIILRGGECTAPVLIDFGLTFNLKEQADSLTPDFQQVGNRFLQLPEHAMFSANKRDLRSDVTFCVGILFFALTKAWPGPLVDEAGRPPHQREAPRHEFDGLPEHQRSRLLHIFDLGFAQELTRRWQSVGSLRDQLKLMTQIPTEESSTELRIASLKERAAAHAGSKIIIGALDAVRGRLKAAALIAIQKLGEGYAPSIEERLTSMSALNTWIRCGVECVYEGRLINTPFLISAVGEEIVVQDLSSNGQPVIARAPVAAPDSVPELENDVVSVIVKNVVAGDEVPL